MSIKPVKVGIVGCGNISGAYFDNSKKLEILEIAACADLVDERAREAAEKWGVAKACSVEELLADPEIEIVVNLTVPKAHFEVSMAAVEAGKHAYAEKPITVSREDGRKLLEAARAKGVLVGNAPDTFLGGGIQTARKVIDDGWIGRPVAATAFMVGHGHESWHPSPEFYYEVGGGPMFDMGPYYLTALVNLLGPIRRVAGSAVKTFETRTITSQPKYGKVVEVETPTHIASVMDFRDGAVATVIMSFDIWGAHLPCIEIHGTEGSMTVPDPNGFGGTVQILRPGNDGWKEVPASHDTQIGRSKGVADMAYAIRSGRAHRASGDLAYHVLDAMQASLDAQTGEAVTLESTCERPAPLPLGLPLGKLDA